MPQTRRQFVKYFVVGTAFCSLSGKRWTQPLLADVRPRAASSGAASFRIKLSDFPVLQNDFGSVRLGVNPGTFFPDGQFYPIIINHAQGPVYYALKAECKHAGCIVERYDADFFNSMVCFCHGSQYGIDGSVLMGPTLFPLDQYPISFDGVDTLMIEVAEMAFSVRGSTAQNNRFRLDFASFPNVEYEVRFRASMNPASDWQPIAFALTIDEPADQMRLTGNGLLASVFVEQTTQTGFYAVNMVMREV